MKTKLTHSVFLGILFGLLHIPLHAQKINALNANHTDSHETDKRIENYLELTNMGYGDREIFEDLGNVGFISQNYDTALFWYQKLREVSTGYQLPSGFQTRYQYAQRMAGSTITYNDLEQRNWVDHIKKDYETARGARKALAQTASPKFNPLPLENMEKDDFLVLNNRGLYDAPVTLTADGNTAYYSKTVYEKPLYGIFSKKELLHKIYKAQKVNGEWKTVHHLNVVPKNFSALHPSVSEDGSQLFFASNMPGSFGEYDIYTVKLFPDGTHSAPKNLGEKVNTKKNDLYPNIVGGKTLFFASEGRNGLGGLDVYMTQVHEKSVGLAVHLGNPINSPENDYAVVLRNEKGMGYVMSNRGMDKDTIQQVAFSYDEVATVSEIDKQHFTVLEALNSNGRIDYSNAVFEDQ